MVPEGSNGAALELALRLALDAARHVEGIGLMVNPQGRGRPRSGVDLWVPGGQIIRRLPDDAGDYIPEGDPIRPPPKRKDNGD